MGPIYLDNAATSFPKPPAVAAAMARYLTEVGASINRGVYASAQDAGMTTLLLREGLCRLFRHGDPTRCILTAGNTMGLNMALRGWLKPGDHCIVSSMEHNAVMRPLHDLVDQGVSFDRIPCDREGRLDPAGLPPLIRPNTRLVAMAHASNVSGAIQDAAAVGKLCRERGIPLLLDAAQTAGHWDIDFEGWGLAALSVPGHKGLMGPSGIGALLLSPEFARGLTPIVSGGTGSASDLWPPRRGGVYSGNRRRGPAAEGGGADRTVPGGTAGHSRHPSGGALDAGKPRRGYLRGLFGAGQRGSGFPPGAAVRHPHPLRAPLRSGRPQDFGYLPPGDGTLQPRVVHHP